MTYRAIVSTSDTALYDIYFVFLGNGEESPVLKNFDILCVKYILNYIRHIKIMGTP